MKPKESSIPWYDRLPLSIRAKMLVAFVGLTLGPMLLLGGLALYRSEQALTGRIAEELRVEVATAAGAMETHLTGVRRDALSLARFLERRLRPRMSEGQWRAVEKEFLETMQTERAYYQVRFISVDGMENIRVNNTGDGLALVPQDRLQYKGDRYYFREAIGLDPGEVYLSHLDFNMEFGRIETPRRLVARVASPVRDQGGQLRGLVVINVFGEELLGALEALKPAADIRVLLLNEQGRFVEMERRPEAVHFATGDEAKLTGLIGFDLTLDSRPGKPRIEITDRHLLAVMPVAAAPERTWHLIKVYPRSVLSGELHRLQRTILLGAAPLVLIAALLAMLAARRFSQPIRRLSDLAGAVAAGDYDQSAPVSSRDEFGQLARALNAMAASLSESRERLLDWNRSLQEEVELKVKALRDSEAETERTRQAMQQLERQLVLADRLAAMGMLSATVAHEIGNPLAGLKMRLQMLRRKAADDGTMVRDLERMLALIDRLEAFLKHFSGYLAPKGEEVLKRVDLAGILDDVAFILNEEAERRGTTLTLVLDVRPLWVCSRERQLHQIFMNLMLNALQAAGEGGEVTVRAARGNERVSVEVLDSGPGIPEKDRGRLFEPLYTTKASGTGLGLAIVKKLVDDLDGEVALRNREEGGAVAVVVLPERREGCETTS